MDTPHNALNCYDSAALSKALFQEVGDGLFLLDPDTDQLLDVNPAAERLSGLTRDQLLAQPATYWLRAGMRGHGSNQRLRRAASNSGIFHSQEGFFLRAAGGTWVPVNVTISRLHLKPKTLALITARDIRAQRQAHAQRQEAERELRRVLASIPDCLWSAEADAAGRWEYRYFSPVVTRLTGRSPDSFLGGPERWRAVVHSDDRPVWLALLARLRGGQAGQEEYRLVREDGEVRWVRDSVLVSPGEGESLRLDGVLTDVTEARHAAAERDRFFELSLDLLCVAGFDGCFKRLNPSWELTLGWERAELLDRPYIDFVHPDDREATLAEAAALATGNHQTVQFENRYRCRDGSYRWLLWNAAPFPEGRLIYATARDITRRRQREEQLRRTAEELERAASSEREAHRELREAQAQLVQAEKLAALGQMVAGVAHEVNNPLAFVINNIEVLRRDVGAVRAALRLYQDAEAKAAAGGADPFRRVHAFAEEVDLPYTEGNLDRLLARSADGLSRIRQIVKDLRDFARLDESDLKEADLNEGVRSTVNIVRGRAVRKGVRLEVDLGPLPPVLCYPAKVNQVVLNLLANAIDACPDGGRVEVRTRAAVSGVEVHVQDNGHGIDPAVRAKIFDPFFTTKPPGQGTGLGLSISHGIVQDHGGTIEVESERGRGAHFTIRLPLRPPAAETRRGP
ncbi:MAG: PAS domain S-box protein [Gemmataceae bacterium]|nr:PAS domain S-box protein [Gemmataceae bacterium]